MAMFKAILESEPSSQCFRVQVLVKGKWRSVCTNSRNWTEADLAVTCRHLGFTGGEWHHWHEHLNDSTVKQILFQDPSKSQSQSAIVLGNFDVDVKDLLNCPSMINYVFIAFNKELVLVGIFSEYWASISFFIDVKSVKH